MNAPIRNQFDTRSQVDRQKSFAYSVPMPAADRHVLAAVVAMMDGEWPDVTFRALIGEDATEEDFEAVDPNYLRDLVAFRWAMLQQDRPRTGLLLTVKDAIDIVGMTHIFPLSPAGLVALVKRFEELYGAIWTPEVRDV